MRASHERPEGADLHDSARANRSAPDSTPASVVRRARILAVDDEEMVLRVLNRVLREHEMVCVTSAEQALDLLEAGQTFDAIMSDVMMPGMTGMDFYQALRVRFPDLLRRLVFMSGGALTAKAADFLRGTANPQVDKPFASEDLLRALKLVL
jgi:CheY-like chemotaxis protein